MVKSRILLLAALIVCTNMFAISNKRPPATETNDTTQSWSFSKCITKPTDEQLVQMSDNDGFSRESSFLFNQLESLCVKRIPLVPGDPTTRIVFSKGDIYNAVRTIQKNLKNKVKNNKITADEAAKELSFVLNVALSAYYSDGSQPFERVLRSMKNDGEQLLALFSKVLLK